MKFVNNPTDHFDIINHKKNYLQMEVFIEDVPKLPFMVYTKEEFDTLLIDKANKTGPTIDGNIALLYDNSGLGDLLDSNFNISELDFSNVYDMGDF